MTLLLTPHAAIIDREQFFAWVEEVIDLSILSPAHVCALRSAWAEALSEGDLQDQVTSLTEETGELRSEIEELTDTANQRNEDEAVLLLEAKTLAFEDGVSKLVAGLHFILGDSFDAITDMLTEREGNFEFQDIAQAEAEREDARVAAQVAARARLAEEAMAALKANGTPKKKPRRKKT